MFDGEDGAEARAMRAPQRKALEGKRNEADDRTKADDDAEAMTVAK